MAQFLVCPISEDNRILSPAVGYFAPDTMHLQPPAGCRCIGVIHRLNDTILLCVDTTADCSIAISPNTWLMVGDMIGEIGAAAETSQAHQSGFSHEIVSPSDGFLIFECSDGKPMVERGAVLHPGSVVAVIELMKIRMDVLYDGPDGARFGGYIGHSQRPVRRGEIIARTDWDELQQNRSFE